jgi:hypothetical protein
LNFLIQLIPALFVFLYCAIQTWRDIRGRHIAMAVWGGILTIMGLFMLVMVTRLPVTP